MLSEIQKTIDDLTPQVEATLARWRGGSKPSATRTQDVETFPPDFRPPLLSSVLMHDLLRPERSVLLGVGSDEGVYFLDLDNPVSGATLIVGDRSCDRGGMIRSMLASATRLNSHLDVSISVVCRQVDDYAEFVQTQHLQEMLPVNDPITSELICEVAAEAVERSQGKRPDPAVLLMIDDLAECLSFLNQTAYERLYWLVRHGPRYKIWTVSTLQSEKMDDVDSRYLAAFRTWLVGHIANPKQAALTGSLHAARLAYLKPNHFYIPVRDEDRLFCACKLD